MKTYDQRMEEILAKAGRERKRIRRRRAIIGGSLCTVLAVLLLVLFVPYSTTPPSVAKYSGSPYYNVIQRLNKATYEPPEYENTFDMLVSQLGAMKDLVAGDMNGSSADAAPGDGWYVEVETPEYIGNYEEVTDNQVAGVIEADLFKRSDKYIYYLRGDALHVYSIAGADSTEVGCYQFDIDNFSQHNFSYVTFRGIYLSQDCATVTVLLDGYTKELGTCMVVVNLDVTDPEKITESDRVYFSGDYLSSRMVDGNILLTYRYQVYSRQVDFEDESTFVPQYGDLDHMTCIPAEDIVCPEEVSNTRYTVICKLDGKTLEMLDSEALLSYSQELYVSESVIYATHAYTQETEVEKNVTESKTMTEITGISYAGDSLEVLGTVAVEGSVADQYSMDEYNGILRVVTSTSVWKVKTYADGFGMTSTTCNCDLYCVDLADWSIRSSVIGFAPTGEEVTSARFDGDHAYVCTAEVIVLTDPVFFFDLTDVDNITWTDTGTIDGYSTSMINFGEGYSLGIGVNAFRELKLEVYRQAGDTVESVCAYERVCDYASEYKAYYIGRENSLVGLPVYDWETGSFSYLLLHFDGYGFNELVSQEIACDGLDNVRATIIDGWLYILSGDFQTVQVW